MTSGDRADCTHDRGRYALILLGRSPCAPRRGNGAQTL
jgi:hypothetical protein